MRARGQVRRVGRRRAGSLALVAIAALVIAFIVALGLLSLADHTLLIARRQPRLSALGAIAEAGLQYGYWQYAWRGVAVPFQESGRACGRGTFSVTVTDNRAATPYTIRVVSTARLGRDTQTLSRVFADPGIGGPRTVFDFALAAGSSVTCASLFRIGSAVQTDDVYAAGDLSAARSDAAVSGRTYTTGTATVTTLGGLDYAYLKPLPFPAINTTTLQSLASRSYTKSQAWTSLAFTKPYDVLFITGDLTLKGPVSGTGTVVVTGAVTINGSISYGTVGSKLAVLTTGGLTVGVASDVVGFYYAHNTTGTAPLTLTASLSNSCGCVVADVVGTLGGDLTVVRDPDFTPGLASSLHLPGY